MNNFFKNKPILGMIHLSGENKVLRALDEIKIYQEEGVDGVIIENYHGSREDVMMVLSSINKGDFNIKIGLNILPNDYELAFETASKYNLDFIQLDYVSGKYEKSDEINHNHYMNNRKAYKGIVLGGVWPKYYYPIKDSDLIEDLTIAMTRCDAVVVTGSGTGKETPIDKIKKFRNIIGDFPLIIGAGMDSNNVDQFEYADGAIVGSCFKPYKRTQEVIDRLLVKEFVNNVNNIRPAYPRIDFATQFKDIKLKK